VARRHVKSISLRTHGIRIPASARFFIALRKSLRAAPSVTDR